MVFFVSGQAPPHPDVELVIPSEVPLVLAAGQRVAVLRPGLKVCLARPRSTLCIVFLTFFFV
jgi:hypothetical protein